MLKMLTICAFSEDRNRFSGGESSLDVRAADWLGCGGCWRLWSGCGNFLKQGSNEVWRIDSPLSQVMNFLSQLNFFQNWNQSSQILPQLYQLIYDILNTLLCFKLFNLLRFFTRTTTWVSFQNHFLCSSIKSNYLFIKVLWGDSRHLVTSLGFGSSFLAISTTSAVTKATDHRSP